MRWTTLLEPSKVLLGRVPNQLHTPQRELSSSFITALVSQFLPSSSSHPWLRHLAVVQFSPTPLHVNLNVSVTPNTPCALMFLHKSLSLFFILCMFHNPTRIRSWFFITFTFPLPQFFTLLVCFYIFTVCG